MVTLVPTHSDMGVSEVSCSRHKYGMYDVDKLNVFILGHGHIHPNIRAWAHSPKYYMYFTEYNKSYRGRGESAKSITSEYFEFVCRRCEISASQLLYLNIH